MTAKLPPQFHPSPSRRLEAAMSIRRIRLVILAYRRRSCWSEIRSPDRALSQNQQLRRQRSDSTSSARGTATEAVAELAECESESAVDGGRSSSSRVRRRRQTGAAAAANRKRHADATNGASNRKRRIAESGTKLQARRPRSRGDGGEDVDRKARSGEAGPSF